MLKNILAGIGILAIIIFIAMAIGIFIVVPKMLKAEPLVLKPDTGYSTEGVLVTVTVTEGDINAKLAANPQIAQSIGQAIGSAGPIPAVKTQNLRLKLEKDRFTALLDADIWGDGTYVTGTMSGKLFVSNGKPAVDLDKISIGVMPFPAPLITRANTELNQKLQAQNLNLPVALKDIKVDNGKLTLIGAASLQNLQLPGR